MKYLNGEYYVEVKDHGYKIHPTESIIYAKQIHQLLSELNIEFRTRLRLERIKKVSKTITIN